MDPAPLNILLVENDPGLSRRIRGLLDSIPSFRFQVEQVPGSGEALLAVKGGSFDLCLLGSPFARASTRQGLNQWKSASEGGPSLLIASHPSSGLPVESLDLERLDAYWLEKAIRSALDRHVLQAQAKYAAAGGMKDPLTGLPNRSLLMDRVGRALERSRRQKGFHFAVLSLDMDRFKRVVDSLGYGGSDRLIGQLGAVLASCLRATDTVAHMESDEFAMLLEEAEDFSDVMRVVERIQEELKRALTVDGQQVFLTPRVGIALSSTGYSSPDQILHDAHTALGRAKSSGKSGYEIFDPGMRAKAVQTLRMETELRQALERKEFMVFYQPIVGLKEGLLAGFEALVRWKHPERGLVPPMEFIPLAEETGLIVPLGQWVLEEACWQARFWRDHFPDSEKLSVSVNLSGKQLVQPGLVGQILRTLGETGLEPRHLKLEITETVLMENLETALSVLEQMRGAGLKLHLDDFGTGYSSLSYLHRFPVDTLKIDRSFISQMGKTGGKSKIVKTIITLAADLGMGVTAEGVETEDHFERLRKMKCAQGQGYFFAKPLEKTAAQHLLSANPRW